MKLLIEHNAFHCIEKCISGIAPDPSDIENLLQICIQIVFCDELILSTLLPDEVINQSKEILLSLDKRSADVIKIGINNSPYQKKVSMCKMVSDILDSEIDYILEEYNDIEKSLNLLPLLSTNQTNQIVQLTSVIQNKDKKKFLSELSEKSLNERQDGLLAYILSQNDSLLEKILSYSLKYNWTFNRTIRLISDVRTVLNDHLAMEAGVIYAPSVLRAREENKKYEVIVSKILSISKEYAELLTCGPAIMLPSFTDILINHGKGDPQGIISEALNLREVFSPLRELIKKKGKNLSFETGEYQAMALRELNDLAQNLYRTRSQSERPSLLQSVINTNTNFSIPLPEIKSFQGWINFKKNKSRIRGFTELSQLMLVNNKSTKYKSILIQRSTKNLTT